MYKSLKSNRLAFFMLLLCAVVVCGVKKSDVTTVTPTTTASTATESPSTTVLTGVTSTSGVNVTSQSLPYCPPGYFPNAATNACDPCKAGTFSPQSGQQPCMYCMPGTYASAAASTQCTACSMGTFTPFPGSSVCMSCMHSQTTNTTGAMSCQQCEVSEYTTAKKTPLHVLYSVLYLCGVSACLAGICYLISLVLHRERRKFERKQRDVILQAINKGELNIDMDEEHGLTVQSTKKEAGKGMVMINMFTTHHHPITLPASVVEI